MKKLIPDPELEQLVRELNEDGGAAGSQPAEILNDNRRAKSPPLHIEHGNALEALLVEMAQRGASDLLIIAGVPPVFRVAGRLAQTADAPLSNDDIQSLLGNLVSGRLREKIDDEGATDFSLRLQHQRFRVNVHRQRGTLAAAIRALPTEIPTLSVMPCGVIPPNPPDLIGHPKFRALLDKLKTDYDWVIIDSPPIATLADSVVLASMSDLMIMVIKHNQNDRDLIRRSLKRLRDIDVRIAGAVLNAVDLDHRYYGDYYYSGQGDDLGRRSARKGPRRDSDKTGRDSKKVAL